MQIELKKILRFLGHIAAIVGVCFVIVRLSDEASDLDLSTFSIATCSLLFGLAAMHCVTNVMLALGWRNILAFLEVEVSRLSAVHIYGVSQIAKYVPGNVFHFASRQAIGQSMGVKSLPLAKSAGLELIALALTGSLFCLLAIPLFVPALQEIHAAISFVVTIYLIYFLIKRFFDQYVFRAAINYLVYFCGTSLIFVLLINLLHEGVEINVNYLLLLVGANTLAWLAGLVTIGSPAGIGVREAILLILLESALIELDLVLVVLLWRVVTVIGDVLFYMISGYTTKFDEKFTQ